MVGLPQNYSQRRYKTKNLGQINDKGLVLLPASIGAHL